MNLRRLIRLRIAAPILVIILALTAAPAPVRAESPALRYIKNRGLDFMDMFGLRIGGAKAGRAAGAALRATALAQVAAVYFDGEHAGMDRRAIGVWRERRLQGALGPLAYTHIETESRGGNDFAHGDTDWDARQPRGIIRNGEYWDDGRERFFACGAEIQTGILPGFEIRFDPMELVDFALGWTTIDIYTDDVREGDRMRPDAPAPGEAGEILPGEEAAPSLPAPRPSESLPPEGAAPSTAPANSKAPCEPCPPCPECPKSGDPAASPAK